MNSLYERRNPHKLYRDKENALIAGVCAGIAEYFGWNRKGMRLIYALLCLIPPFFPFMAVGLYETKEQAEFWRGVSNAPSDVFGSLSHRFRELTLRLERMEAFVTSKEFEIDRELSRGSHRGEPAR
jgi:phage shock protein C